MDKRIILVACFSAAVSGCGQAIGTLKSLDAGQQEMSREVYAQRREFDLLLSDIKEKRLKAGISIGEFIKTYGEPILEEQQASGLRLLYRYPLEFFGAKKAYVYFDEHSRLSKWIEK